MTETLELLSRGALIGAGGAAAMDLWGWVAGRALGTQGLDYALLGRWIGHLARGRISHASLASAEKVRGERLLGWAAHYSIGIGFALLLLLAQGRQWVQAPTLWPAHGAGYRGVEDAPLRNLASHTAYGLGLYAAAVALATV